jgi:hypothetical protein
MGQPIDLLWNADEIALAAPRAGERISRDWMNEAPRYPDSPAESDYSECFFDVDMLWVGHFPLPPDAPLVAEPKLSKDMLEEREPVLSAIDRRAGFMRLSAVKRPVVQLDGPVTYGPESFPRRAMR